MELGLTQGFRRSREGYSASALSKSDPFVLSKTDPHQEHDLPVGKTVSSTPKACCILPTGKISNFRAWGPPDSPLVRLSTPPGLGAGSQTASPFLVL